MSSHYYSSSYQPVSPPSSSGSASPYYHTQPMAPVMPYRSLPSVEHQPSSPHHGLITPPASDSGVNPLLCASPTVVRYDFTQEPHTIRMSSSVRMASFPTTHPASIPSHSTIYIECEGSGLVVPIHHGESTHGVTCSDVFLQLYAFFARPLPSDEWRRVPEPQRSAMKAAFSRRSARQQDPTMRMIDYLQGRNVFKRLIANRGGRSSSPTWLLQTSA